MILNDVMAIILCYFTRFSSLGVNEVRVVEVRSIVSGTKMYPQESYFSAIYDLWWYSHRLPRKTALKNTSTQKQNSRFMQHCTKHVHLSNSSALVIICLVEDTETH